MSPFPPTAPDLDDDLDEPDVYEEVDILLAQRAARVDEFITDAERSLDHLDNDLAHGNVLAAREDALSLRVHVRLLVKALGR